MGVGDVFFTVLEMSGYGMVAAASAMLVWLIFRHTRCSKTALLLLWVVVGFRLVCPWSPPSPVSLFNLEPFALADAGERIYTGDAHRAVNNPDGQSRSDFERAVRAGVEPVQDPVSSLWEVHYYENNAGNITPAKTLRDAYGGALFAIWLAGALAFLIYGGASYLKLNRRLRFAIRDEDEADVWYSDYIPSPCVVGFLRPRVYLTFGMDEGQHRCVLAHERQHLANHDHIWKALGWLMMCLHWFNPLLWLAWRGFLGMIEDACDQRVLRELGEEQKADYGQALLSLSTGNRFHPGMSPLAFGEGDTKERVKNVLNYRKPLAWLTGAALVLCAAVGVCVLTGRAEDPVPPGIEASYGEYKVDEMVHLTILSSNTPNYLLERCRGDEIVFTAQRFHAGALDVEGPVYEPLALGDTLPTTELGDEEFQAMTAIDLTAYDSVQGWKVLTAEGGETGAHVFAVDGKLWLGRWVEHDNAAIPYGEYWEIMGARRAESFAPAVETDPPAPVPSAEATDSPAPSDEALDTKPAEEDAAVTFTAAVTATDPDNGTLTVRPEAGPAGVELFRFDYWEPDEFQAGDRMLIKAAKITTGEDGVSTGVLYDAIPLSNPVAEWRVDLTHDGTEERVYVTECGKYESFCYLIVEDASGERILWHTAANGSHVGQNGIYLYTDPADGSHYLLHWVPYMSMGLAGYGYELFTLADDGTPQYRQQNTLMFDVCDVWSGDPEEIRAFDQEINQLLEHSEVLLSTNYDTPEGVFWGAPDHLVRPGLPFDSHPEYFEERQALAQGTYTFTGEILEVLEDGYIVVDTTLWRPLDDGCYMSFIPAEALDTSMCAPDEDLTGRRVTVTADGPLHRQVPPDEGTHVEAKLVGDAAAGA